MAYTQRDTKRERDTHRHTQAHTGMHTHTQIMVSAISFVVYSKMNSSGNCYTKQIKPV